MVAAGALWAVAACALACEAQAPIERRPAQDPPLATLQLASRLVTLAVNAVDAHGSPVGGLERTDFSVFEDGKPQKIAFFEKESATPLSIVLAIDGSESTQRDAKLEREAARSFVRAVIRTSADSSDEMDLMEFSDNVQELVSFTRDPHRIETGLGSLSHGDATAMYDAIYLASQRLGETQAGGGRRRVLVLITDGGDTVHGIEYPQALEAAQRAGVMIYALIVVPIQADAGRNTGGEHALMQISEDTGGRYFYVEDPRDFSSAFARVSDDLRAQYVLGYYAPEGPRGISLRRVAVKLTDPKLAALSLRYRTAYYRGVK